MQDVYLGLSCRNLPSPTAPEKVLPCMVAETSILWPFSVMRWPPMVSKFSSDRPMGSLWVWHEAQVEVVAWAIRRSRTVLRAPSTSLTTEKSTLAGGAGVGSQRKMSISATPRLVGELRPGWENMDSMLTWVRTPLRPAS